MRPLVTLAVMTYRRPDYLRDTLACVRAQDYDRLDILVSDNGSGEDVGSVIREGIAGDPRIRVRRNPTSVPIHEHFTQCVNAARGEFIVLLSDDDRINPEFVSELAGVATRNRGVNVVVPANILIDERGAIVEELPRPHGESFDGFEFVCDWLYRRTPQVFASVVTMMARTEVVRRFGGYQGFARGQGNDNLVFLQCALTGRVGFAHRAAFSWRVYGRSYGSTASPHEIAQAARQFVRHLQTDPATTQMLAALTPAQRTEIIKGVRTMTAKDYLHRTKFYENPFTWHALRSVAGFQVDGVFYKVVLRQYYNSLRLLFAEGDSRMATAK